MKKINAPKVYQINNLQVLIFMFKLRTDMIATAFHNTKSYFQYKTINNQKTLKKINNFILYGKGSLKWKNLIEEEIFSSSFYYIKDGLLLKIHG